MKLATRKELADVARYAERMASHEFIDGKNSNIKLIIDLFPKWNIRDADWAWCAAFVFYCCIKVGFVIPYSLDECVTAVLQVIVDGKNMQ